MAGRGAAEGQGLRDTGWFRRAVRHEGHALLPLPGAWREPGTMQRSSFVAGAVAVVIAGAVAAARLPFDRERRKLGVGVGQRSVPRLAPRLAIVARLRAIHPPCTVVGKAGLLARLPMQGRRWHRSLCCPSQDISAAAGGCCWLLLYLLLPLPLLPPPPPAAAVSSCFRRLLTGGGPEEHDELALARLLDRRFNEPRLRQLHLAACNPGGALVSRDQHACAARGMAWSKAIDRPTGLEALREGDSAHVAASPETNAASTARPPCPHVRPRVSLAPLARLRNPHSTSMLAPLSSRRRGAAGGAPSPSVLQGSAPPRCRQAHRPTWCCPARRRRAA